MPTTTKQSIWDLFGSSAKPFALYCHNKASDDAIAISYMFENIEGLDLNADAVKYYVLPTLLAAGVIDQGVIDRIAIYTGT